MSPELKAAIRKLVDEAVTAGRADWDSYYGHNNEHHLTDLEKWPTYIELEKLLQPEPKETLKCK